MARPPLAAWCCGGVVGLVLVAAAIAKLSHPNWADEAEVLSVSRATARWIPWIELTLGAALVAGVAYPISAVFGFVFCAALTVFVVRVLAHGRRPVCACFGGWSRKPLGVTAAARNACLTALAALAAVL